MSQLSVCVLLCLAVAPFVAADILNTRQLERNSRNLVGLFIPKVRKYFEDKGWDAAMKTFNLLDADGLLFCFLNFVLCN